MLFIASFSYSDDYEAEENYVLMPCVVSADDPQQALDRLSELLQHAHDEADGLFSGTGEVYLESLVGMDDVPEDGLIVQWQKVVPSDDGLVLLSSALPYGNSSAVSYEFADDTEGADEDEDGFDDEAEDDEDSDDDAFMEPFMTFE
jgi:hypothetical protein